MKLKKIVSLALAGVLAVSMLAGCAGKTGSADSETEVTTGGAYGVSAKVAALMDEDAVTFSDNTTYINYLSSAIEKTGLKYGDLKKMVDQAEWTNNTVALGLGDEFKYNVVDYQKTIENATDFKTAGVYMQVYTLSGDKTEDVAVALMAKKLDNKISTIDPKDSYLEGDKYVTAEYTGSVSLEKVSDGSTSVWFALVTVTVDTTSTDATSAPEE